MRGKCLSGTVAVSGPGPSDTASPTSLGRISEEALAGSHGWLSALTKGSTGKQEASTGAAEEGNEEAGPEGRGHVPFHGAGPRAGDQPLPGAGGAGLLDPGCAPLPLWALLVGSGHLWPRRLRVPRSVGTQEATLPAFRVQRLDFHKQYTFQTDSVLGFGIPKKDKGRWR